MIKSWLNSDFDRFELLYRASRDGYRAYDFHERCDNQGPTLCVIKTTDDIVMGGFSGKSWTSTNAYASDTAPYTAFIFTFNKDKKIDIDENH